jgi:glycosyltransferase involved in cell wall biosynthesis
MDVERFLRAEPLDDAELRAAFSGPLPDGARVVLMVAALEPRKRVREFIETFAAIVRSEPAAVLVVLGDGVDRPVLEETVRRLGLEAHVALPGFRSDVERWIRRADVCVLASEREGLPRVIVQYALGGSPMVSTALPGVEAIVDDGVTGYLTPIDDVAAMAAPVLRILRDHTLAAAMRANVRALDLSRWSVSSMVDELDRVYARVLTGTRMAA